MLEVQTTQVFEDWLNGLRDSASRAVIARRITRLERGLLGDVKSVGGDVSELRIDYGPGFRVYFTVRDKLIVVLLCGGDKSAQGRDIAKAKRLAKEI